MILHNKPIMKQLSSCLLIAASLSACATTDGPQPTATSAPAAEAPSSNAAPTPHPTPNANNGDQLLSRIDDLGVIELADGHCGLFLWSATLGRKLVYFADTSTNSNQMKINGQAITFTRNKAVNELYPGLFSSQSFSGAGYNLTLDLNAEPREGMTDGLMVPQARLRLSDSSGWEIVTQTAGIYACKRANSANDR